MSGQRCGLAANAFHQIPIAAEGVDLVVEYLEAGAVEVSCQPISGNCHTDAVPDSLTQRAGGGFYARRVAVFGMSWSLAVDLAEPLNVIHSDSELAGRLILRIHAPNF